MQITCDRVEALQPFNKKASFASAGVAYDNGEYFASGEYGKRSTDSLVSDNTNYYVSGGMRIGKLTPFATYSNVKIDGQTKSTIAVVSATTGLANNLDTAMLQEGATFDQNSITLGARYDIAKNVALKAQWDLIKTNMKSGEPGTGVGVFRNDTAAFGNQDNTVKVLSFAVDFVF